MIAYRLYADEELLLDTQDGINDGILSASFKLELNKSSSAEFSMVTSHPFINKITMMKTSIIIEMLYIDDDNVVKDDYYPFMGRVSAISQDMYGNKTFTCEGASAFENDQVIMNDLQDLAGTLHVNDVFTKSIGSSRTLTNGIVFNPNYYNENNGSNVDWTLTDEIVKEIQKSDSEEESGGDEPSYSYEKSSDMIQNNIISPYGGVVYYYYAYNQFTDNHTMLKEDFLCYAAYFNTLLTGFDYTLVDQNGCPKEPTGVVELYYGEETPSFGLNDNIIDIKPNYLKTGIWTGIIPVGKDGLTIFGEKGDYDTYRNTLWESDLVNKYGEIHKVVNFSRVDDPVALLAFGRNYMARFANNDYYAMQTYEINGIEPCEVFEPTRYLIKLGYYVILQINANTLISFPCLSIEHNLFDIQQSRYVIGPVVPDTILNEDFTAVYH